MRDRHVNIGVDAESNTISESNHVVLISTTKLCYIYIYITWPTVVENDLKVFFSITTTPRCRIGY